MTKASQRPLVQEFRLLATPVVLFLLVFLGFPAIVNLIYSVSDVVAPARIVRLQEFRRRVER
jgi:multiple sugar transport system permease protein